MKPHLNRRLHSLSLVVCLFFFSIHSSTCYGIELNWSEDGSRCWYRASAEGNEPAYYIVDVNSGSRDRVFDEDRLAKAFAAELGDDFSPERFRVTFIQFTNEPRELILTAFEKQWRLNLDDYHLTPFTQATAVTTSRNLFLPPRNSQNGGASTMITITNHLDQEVGIHWIDRSGKSLSYGGIAAGATRSLQTYVGHVWLLRNASGQQLGCFVARAQDQFVVNQKLIDSVDNRDEKVEQGNKNRRRNNSPDGQWTAFLRENQLWIKSNDSEVKLSETGAANNSFGSSAGFPDVRWSPDSRFLVAFQTKDVPARTVHFVESSPKDQLQSKLHSFPYRKPGDELPQQTIHVYSVDGQHRTIVSDQLFPNPWSLKFIGWSEDGQAFRLLYNQRGHQVLRLLEVDVTNGQARIIIDEKSDTFIHYSTAGKSVLEELDSDTVLWSSERSGWNHLYRYSAKTGDVINEVTSGDWNVRNVVKIDRDTQTIWFMAVGIVGSQDPYHEHFCRVQFDGSGLKVLTAGDGTHGIEFERDGEFFVDTYSRVDMAPVTELRKSADGKLVCRLIEEETEQYFKDRRVTERFIAKGRDGTTDIWGVIHWPKDFDENKSYPVVEYIYAGPHDHHVPKSFRSQYRHQHQVADAGMIVVQIDGMGTAWRSKKFHDVCYKNLRDAGFPDRIAWMKAAAKEFPQMDLSRVGIYGGSAGGQNAMAALLWHNDFYKVAVADCGCHDNRMDKIWWNEQWMGWPIDESYKENSNMENAHLLQGDLMLIVGELDRNVDPASTTQVVHQLIKHDKDFEFVLVTGTGHGSAETRWASKKRLNFLKEHLLEGKAD